MARIIVNEGDGPRSVALSAERTVVGSNPQCDVVLRHDSALGARFVLERTPGGWRVEVIKGHVLHNETETSTALLAHNDTLRVGESMVLFKDPEGVAGAVAPDVGRPAADSEAGLADALPDLEEVTAAPAPAAPAAEPGRAEPELPPAQGGTELGERPPPSEALEAWEAPEADEALDVSEDEVAAASAAEPAAEDEAVLGDREEPAGLEEFDELEELEELEEFEDFEEPEQFEEPEELAEPEALDGAADVEEPEDVASPVEASTGARTAEGASEQAPQRDRAADGGDTPDLAVALETVSLPDAPASPAPRRAAGPIRFRRPLPPGCKAPTFLPPVHPGRPPR